MKPKLHTYGSENDYWRARAFFRRIRPADAPPGGNWDVALFDYWRWHWLENVVERSPDELCLWTDADDRVVAVLNQGDPGVCHLHVDPDVLEEALLDEMVREAEARYATRLEDGRRVVCVWTMDDETTLRCVLERRGYEGFASEHSIEYNGRRLLSGPIASAAVPDGFVVRAMGDVDELPKRSLASWRAFHPGEPDSGCDRTGAWYRNVQRAPLYRRDLDVVAVAPNGDVASFALCYFDDVSRSGVFVLDGTAPAYQKRGLGKAVMLEALRRLQWLGATAAYVSWYGEPAGALYRAVGFADERRGRALLKTL